MSDSLNKYKLSCALTGHRRIGGGLDVSKLNQTIESVIEQGTVSFYCGMAIGFDLIAAAAVLECKKKHPKVKLIACIPCPEQDKYYSSSEREKYRNILQQCDDVIIVNERYFDGCMLVRDRFMVDNCEKIIAYFDGRSDGGTAYTVKYAKSKNREIIIV